MKDGGERSTKIINVSVCRIDIIHCSQEININVD